MFDSFVSLDVSRTHGCSSSLDVLGGRPLGVTRQPGWSHCGCDWAFPAGTVAVEDGTSDIAMISGRPFGVAMGGASDEVRSPPIT